MPGPPDPTTVLPLYEPEGQELHIVGDRGSYQEQAPSISGASMSGSTPRYSVRSSAGLGGTARPNPVVSESPKRRLTDAELMKAADELEAHMSSSHKASMDAGPYVHDPMAPAPWLDEFMASQPSTDPYKPPTMTYDDMVKKNRFMSEEDKAHVLGGGKIR